MNLTNIIKGLRKPDPREKEISELIEKTRKEEKTGNIIFFLSQATELYQNLIKDRGKNYRKDLLYEIKKLADGLVNYEAWESNFKVVNKPKHL